MSASSWDLVFDCTWQAAWTAWPFEVGGRNQSFVLLHPMTSWWQFALKLCAGIERRINWMMSGHHDIKAYKLCSNRIRGSSCLHQAAAASVTALLVSIDRLPICMTSVQAFDGPAERDWRAEPFAMDGGVAPQPC